MSNQDYDKKINLCKKLGAKQFQKVVLAFDNKKWKLIKKLVPNYINIGDSYLDKKKDKQLKKAKTYQEKENIMRQFTYRKMLLRKEYNNGENINYHINTRPSEFISYLNWNKSVHQRGLIFNIATIPVLATAIALGFNFAIPLVVFEGIDMFKNFQCVNIQNYNIYRLKKIEKTLKKKEQMQEERQIEQYGDAYEVIGKTLEEKKDIVSIDEILNNIKSKEQLIQLKKLINEEKKARRKEVESKGVKL